MPCGLSASSQTATGRMTQSTNVLRLQSHLALTGGSRAACLHPHEALSWGYGSPRLSGHSPSEQPCPEKSRWGSPWLKTTSRTNHVHCIPISTYMDFWEVVCWVQNLLPLLHGCSTHYIW